MVEENEIRSDLSHYERGRVAVMATSQGAFVSVEDAVNELFHAGSKAKRSKIRAFAELHEELGDLLNFAPNLSERQGLRLVGAIRSGMAPDLRRALGAGVAQDAASDDVLTQAEQMRAAFLASPGLPELAEPPEIVPGGVHEVLAFRQVELNADLVCIGTHSGRDPGQLGHYARDLMRAPPTDLLIAKPG
jgi:nucleotide-binding universal stress UspA family protein